jgi:lipopolysaccharide/colanic/teichoic acid biosynthesis glycosyltransferase
MEAWFVKPLPRWKRCIDIVGASLGLVLFSPVMLVAALAIRLTSPGPAIFKQERAALGGRPFWMYKFRTMVAGAEQQQELLRPLNEQDGPAFKLSDDPRITPVGRWLRKTSIDELPQLWNVLKGDMSLVGPRPLPVRESDQCRQWHRARLGVTPGLTCIWQVNGRCNTNFDRWVRMDLDYIRRRSLGFDLLLLAWTIPAVLLQRGAK